MHEAPSADASGPTMTIERCPIRVKLIARGATGMAWAGQTPRGEGRWNGCQFLFDPAERDYNWLVVIDDASRDYGGAPEVLACADEHTLLVTTEPPTITRYGRAFSGQFAHVLTSQDEAALPHPSRFHSHTGNLWFCGRSFDELEGTPFPEKTLPLSTVCSSKQQRHTLHELRHRFTYRLKERMPELDIFGHGVRYIDRKHQALEPYRFHLAIENHVAPHHWTEKLADPILCGAVPIYFGCPNVGDYFPAESFVAIDIRQPEAAAEAIQALLADPDSYAKRLEALGEAKRLVLHEYNLMAILDRFVSERFDPRSKPSGRPLYGRKRMRGRNPADLFSHALWEIQKNRKSPGSS